MEHNLVMELTAARMMERDWIVKDFKRLLIFYKTQQNRLKELFDNHLKLFAKINLPKAGLFVYITFNKPFSLLLILEVYRKLGVFDPFLNQHVDLLKPINAIRLGYAAFTIREWDFVFQTLADHFHLIEQKN